MEVETQNAKVGARKDVYAIINEKVIEQLNKGTVPWHKPWNEAGLPKNIISGRHYRGINLMLLAMEGYERNQFITFKQLHEIGGRVKKNEKGHMVVYWNRPEQQADEEPENADARDQKKKPVLRYYYVFNIAQCENIPEKYLQPEREAKDIPSCEAIVKGMPKCPPIRHKEQSAYYDPLEDFVNMPKKRSFKTDDAYYSTLFHELVHSTGHPLRLDRKEFVQMAERDGAAYSQEELVAEMGACYLQSYAGIQSQFQQSTAYIQGWLRQLKNDRRFIFLAASSAQKAVDFILNVKNEAEEKYQSKEE